MSEKGHWKYNPETGKLEPIEKDAPVAKRHAVITDEIPGGLRSMVDGKTYTSKAELRRHYKRAGVIEIGEETEHLAKYNMYEDESYLRQIKEDAEKAYYEVRDGMSDLDELDREKCRIMDHNNKHYNFDRRDYDDDGNTR